jgi:hypothetical protein
MFEKKYSLPNKLLGTISIVETGRFNKTINSSYPWPWTINQGGTPFYFNSKLDTLKAIKNMLKDGITNIDVGCMQINLHYHLHNFKSIYHALEPRYNVEYGARLLANHYEKHKDWSKAIAAYHSFSPLGYIYLKKVHEVWAKQHNYELFKIMHQFSPRMKPNRLKSSLVVE